MRENTVYIPVVNRETLIRIRLYPQFDYIPTLIKYDQIKSKYGV